MASDPARVSLQALRLFLLAVTVRLTLWLILGTPNLIDGDDQSAFLAIKDGLLATGRFLDPDTGFPLAHRDPGYPLFLAVLTGIGLKDLVFVWVTQILISSLTGVFLWLALRNAAGEGAARNLGVLFLMQLSFASYGFFVYSETLACCLAGGLLFAMVKWRRAPGVGPAAGPDEAGVDAGHAGGLGGECRAGHGRRCDEQATGGE